MMKQPHVEAASHNEADLLDKAATLDEAASLDEKVDFICNLTLSGRYKIARKRVIRSSNLPHLGKTFLRIWIPRSQRFMDSGEHVRCRLLADQ